MFARKKPEVLVVGAGPVGLFTALVLSSRGIAVQIVEAGSRATMRSYALALHPETLRLFEPLGLLMPVLERSHRVRAVGLYEGGARRGALRIGDIGEDFSFVAVLPQEVLEELMADELRGRGVKVFWNHQVAALQQEADAVEVAIDRLSQDTVGYSVQHTEWVVAKTTRLRFPFVVGADGHASTVRRALGIEQHAVGPAQEFAVFEFVTDRDPGDEMRLGLDRDKANVYWPLPGRACRFSFECEPEAPDYDTREKDRDLVPYDAADFADLDEAKLRSLLSARTPWFDGAVRGVRWRKKVRFEPRLTDGCGQGRVWLVGDAVHVTGPAGVQSMNVAFREALVLADAIERGLQGHESREAFGDYGRACLAEWRRLLGRDEWLVADDGTAPWVAQNHRRLLPCIPSSGAGLERLARQVGLGTAART